MSIDRPTGLTALVAICVLLALLSTSFAVLIFTDKIALSRGAFLLGGGLEQLGPLPFLLYAAILLILALGLWKRWPWVRRAAILLAVAGIALAVPAISNAVADSRVFAIVREGVQIIVRVLVVFYLSQEPVKDWFAARS
jgi:hypothetical protein